MSIEARSDIRPDISVIVPVWNGSGTIEACLEALEAQTLDRSRYEIIVVDNGSTDPTCELVERRGSAVLVREPAPGSYAARNRGLQAARGALVAFTDADCRPAPDWLERALATAATQMPFGVLAGRIALDQGAGAQGACARFDSLFAFNQERNVSRGFAVTANWVSPLELVRGAGGFDGALKSSGDMELSRRLAAAGHPVRYVPEMVVSHPSRDSLKELIGKRLRVVGGRWDKTAPARRAGLFLGALKEGLHQTRRALAAPDWSLGDRAGVAAVAMLLGACGAWEVLRLALGGASRRS